MAKPKPVSSFTGRWRIVSMSAWDEDYIDEDTTPCAKQVALVDCRENDPGFHLRWQRNRPGDANAPLGGGPTVPFR